MSNKSNNQGRAYEFICLHSLHEAIEAIRPAQIIQDSSCKAAAAVWDTLNDAQQEIYTLSVKSTAEAIFALKPNTVEVDNNSLDLFIQSDQHGKVADVHDIIIQYNSIVWEIGLSIKHNHMAAKHSRLSRKLDFGEKWCGKECPKAYWDDTEPIFTFLEAEKKKGTYFCELKSKEEDVYIPLFKAFMAEIKKQIEKDNTIPRKLVAYLLSKYDFYRVIGINNKQLTTIQSFNMCGTLNLPGKKTSPTLKAPMVELPKPLLYIGLKPNSKITIIMSFDEDWQLSFHIHNAKDLVEPSLKFDIQILGMPVDVDIKHNCK